jgi:Zn-finger nucleic acid-binding protein
MKCPACSNVQLISQELQPDVTAQKCIRCGGLWLSSLEFDGVIEAIRTGKAVGSFSAEMPLPVEEPKAAKLCPECGHFMTRYKVGQTLSFSLDRCGNCGGSWFDGNEWETLRASPYWDQIHLVFTPAWQARIRRAEQAAAFRSQLASRIGPADLAEAERVKAWLKSHPHRAAIVSYLTAEER